MAEVRLGFLGLGWIGRQRMGAMLAAGTAEAVAFCDPSDAMCDDAAKIAPRARRVATLDAMLDCNLDGLAIATPSALHAGQAIRGLRADVAVFCQKPLARSAEEARAVVDAARAADRLLAVDMSYRFTEGMIEISKLIRAGSLGRIFAVDLVFHNAYGPDKAWFYDRAQSGGGCLMDLGVHLVDLALSITGDDEVAEVTSASLFSGGQRVQGEEVEDYAEATLRIGEATVRLACSWRLHAGQDAVIAVSVYGSDGGAQLRNVNGSFYDFEAWHCAGTRNEIIAGFPDAWSGRAGVDWVKRLASGGRFCATAESSVAVHTIVDRIYSAARTPPLVRHP